MRYISLFAIIPFISSGLALPRPTQLPESFNVTSEAGGAIYRRTPAALARRQDKKDDDDDDDNDDNDGDKDEKRLFPVGKGVESWSVTDSKFPLNDQTLPELSDMEKFKHPYEKAPDGVMSMKVFYPQGTAALNGKEVPPGGVSFYTPGPKAVDLSTAKEATFALSVYFEKDFGFKLGGKIPGLYGGDDAKTAMSCSGGRKDITCFSTRFMWRDGGKGEGYWYLPPGRNGNKIPNNDYGASVGTGKFMFEAGKRVTIAQRVVLNDVNGNNVEKNGEVEMYCEGKSVLKIDGLVIRTSDKGRFRGIQMQSFFGGHSLPWVSPKNQSAWFGEFSAAIIKKF